jgi:hypothetical protein
LHILSEIERDSSALLEICIIEALDLRVAVDFLLLFHVSRRGRRLGAAEVIELAIGDCWSPHQVL